MSAVVRRSAGFTLFLWMVFVLLFIQRERAGVPAPVFYAGGHDSALPLYQWLTELQAGMPWFIVTGLTFLLAFIDGFILMRLMVRNMVVQERSYMPVLVFLIVAFGTASGGFSLIGTIIALLLVLSTSTMLDSFRRELQLSKVFNSAFLAGTVAIIYPGGAVYLPILLFAMVIFRKTWREWIVCFAGFLAPLILCSYICWMTGGGITEIWEILASEVTARFHGRWLPAVIDPYSTTFLGITCVLTICTVVDFMRSSSTTRTRPYKTFVYFFWILIFSTLLLAAPARSPMDFFLLAIPLAVVISIYLVRNNSLFATILFLVFILSALVNNLNIV